MRAELLSQIDLIREYRTRLIADVVTGKLDVREEAANLPEEVDGDADYQIPYDEIDDVNPELESIVEE